MPIEQRWYYPTAIVKSLILQRRTYYGALSGVLTYIIFQIAGWFAIGRLQLAWDVGGIVYLSIALYYMNSCSIDYVKRMAAREDDSRSVILTVILLSIGASFITIANLIEYAKQEGIGEQRVYLTGLAIITIVISWCVTQMAFTLHYAHEYYEPSNGGDAAGGLIFAGKEDPDYWDFLYFATSIGATSQTSDTAVSSRDMRRLVTIHAVIAFFFNTAVLALTVNMASSLA